MAAGKADAKDAAGARVDVGNAAGENEDTESGAEETTAAEVAAEERAEAGTVAGENEDTESGAEEKAAAEVAAEERAEAGTETGERTEAEGRAEAEEAAAESTAGEKADPVSESRHARTASAAARSKPMAMPQRKVRMPRTYNAPTVALRAAAAWPPYVRWPVNATVVRRSSVIHPKVAFWPGLCKISY